METSNHQQKEVEINIKSPSSTQDFKIKLGLKDTILQVKEKLAFEYPTNPPVHLQKLIFAGRLLKDDSVMSEVLNQFDTNFTQTFHLVVSKPQPQQNIPQQNFGNFNNPNLRADQFQQNVIPQQNMFAQAIPNQNQNQNQNNDGDRDRDANGGASGLYLLVKLGVLVYILSNGGSTLRTVFIVIGAFLIFLHQTGRLRIAVQRNQQPLPVPQPIPQPQPQQQENNDVGVDAAENRNVNNVNVNPNVNVNNSGIFTELSALVGPFFYSLLPTWTPQPITNANPNPNPVFAPEQPVIN